jgi:hypothetical protein
MMISRVARLLLLLCLSLVVVTLTASGPTFWTIGTAAEFLKGTSDGAFISLNGILTSGPQLTSRLTSTPPQVWSLIQGTDGTIWAGTGGDGRVIRWRPGAAAQEETVFDAEETQIFALATNGTRLFAASSPDGRVYAIETDGTSRTFFDPSEKYIWALAVDATGRLWVGAGNPAVIYRVDGSGTGTVVYRPPAAHVVSLVRDAQGRMLAGTESPGRLYRLDSADRPFVVLESGLTELRASTLAADGTIYAAAVSRGDEAASATGETTSIAAIAASATPPAGSSPAATPSSSRRSILYRIDPNGTWEAIWETPDQIYDVVAQDDGVLVATGPEGRLYKIDRNRQVLLLTGVDAKQITRFTRNASGALSAVATANPGRVITVGAGEQSPASYVSPVRDTKSVSSWGLIRWESAGPVALFTRSGNTEKPDDSWSEWAGPYTRREGEAIKSPPARFIQWRSVLTRATAPPSAQLTGVTVAYLTRNTRPEVSSVTAHPPGVVFQRPFSSEEGAVYGLDSVTADARRPAGDPGQPAPAPGRRMYQKGLQTIAWKAEDADSDNLQYSLEYRREGETVWKSLRQGLTDTIYVWDTTAVADGRYVVRVSASDVPSNAADRAAVGTRESELVQVDNTPPTITTEIARQGTTSRLIVRAHDTQSPIQRLEYSIGGGVWQLVYPADGLADSQDERYEIPLASEADAARIVIRAVDALQNVTSQPVK